MDNIISHPFISYSIIVTLTAYIMVNFITRYLVKSNFLTGLLWLSVLMVGPAAYLLDYANKSCTFLQEGKGLHYLCFLSASFTNFLFPFLMLFLAFAIYRTIKGVYGYYTLTRNVTRYSTKSLELENMIKDKINYTIPVYIYDLPMNAAFTIGFFKPRIYISKRIIDNLEENELGCVLIHEATHGKSKDNLGKLVLLFVRDLMFFNPLINKAFLKYSICKEISCDKVAASHYSSAILNNCLLKIAKFNFNPYMSNFSEGAFIERINGLKQDKQICYKDLSVIICYLITLSVIISIIC